MGNESTEKQETKSRLAKSILGRTYWHGVSSQDFEGHELPVDLRPKVYGLIVERNALLGVVQEIVRELDGRPHAGLLIGQASFLAKAARRVVDPPHPGPGATEGSDPIGEANRRANEELGPSFSARS